MPPPLLLAVGSFMALYGGCILPTLAAAAAAATAAGRESTDQFNVFM